MPDSPEATGRTTAPPGYWDIDQVEAIAALKYDVAARTAIDLATGILMEQRDIDATEALALLEHLSDRDRAESIADGIVRLQSDVSVAPAPADSREPLTS